jgi:hypothetical protein
MRTARPCRCSEAPKACHLNSAVFVSISIKKDHEQIAWKARTDRQIRRFNFRALPRAEISYHEAKELCLLKYGTAISNSARKNQSTNRP